MRVGGILHLAQELNKTQYSDSCYVKQNLVAVSRKVQTKINAFEMKALRKLLRISLKERKTNEWILQKANTDPRLLAEIQKRKFSYYRHVMRKGGSCLQ